MLIFGDGLRIRFWNVKKQRTEGVIQFKTTLTPDAYIVDTVESGSCMVHEDQIIQVRMRDMVGDDIWVNIDDIYASFPNGTVITPLTKYNTTSICPGNTFPKVRLSPITSNSLKYATSCPTVNIEPIKDFSELAKQYVTMDIKVCDEVVKKTVEDITICEVKNMFKNIKVKNFETMMYSGSENVECRLEFSTSFEDAAELRNAFDKIYDRDIADAIAYGMSNCLCKPGARKSGRYLWSNASGINFQGKYYKTNGLPVPKKVIFNGPATVVLWTDNTKTVVKKSEDEPDDREKALMYCIFKKFLDDKKRDMDRYLKLFYKVLEEDKKDEEKKEAGGGKLHWKKQRAGEGSSESTV